MLIGIHQSFDNPLFNIILTAKHLGANTFQIFLRNNRNMRRRAISSDEVSYFNTIMLQSAIDTFVVHASYAMNPCTDDNEKRKHYISIVKDDLTLLNRFAGTKYYVLHPGSAKDLDTSTALKNLYNFLFEIKDNLGNVKIALEYMAGAGTQVLCTPEQIYYIMALCYDIPNICICYDTCHVFGSGQGILETYNKLQQYVGVIHLNNSSAAFASRKDRHANLMTGLIPETELNTFIKNVKSFKRDIPVILETPGTNILSDFTWLKSVSK